MGRKEIMVCMINSKMTPGATSLLTTIRISLKSWPREKKKEEEQESCGEGGDKVGPKVELQNTHRPYHLLKFITFSQILGRTMSLPSRYVYMVRQPCFKERKK